jgi:hypothetical protein
VYRLGIVILTMLVGNVQGVVVQISNLTTSGPANAFRESGIDVPSTENATYADVEVCISYLSSASAKAVCEEGDQCTGRNCR